MAVRDILNYLGEKVGEMEQPDDYTEEQWAEAMAPYAAPPPNQQEYIESILERTVLDSQKLAAEIMQDFKKSNLAHFMQSGLTNEQILLQSLWVHHRLRAIEINVGGLPLTIDLMNLVVSGDLETAYVVLSYMSPDDMSQPFHYLSAEVIGILKTLINDRLGLE